MSEAKRQEWLRTKWIVQLWYASLPKMPQLQSYPRGVRPNVRDGLFTTEKATILHARQLRVTEVDRLLGEVAQLNDRLDQIESEEK